MVEEKQLERERVSIFIDGSNFYHSMKDILKKEEIVNYQKLINILVGGRELVNVYYYVASLDASLDLEKYNKHHRFLEILTKIPKFNVVLCNLKKIKTDDKGFVYIVKGDDVRLSQDLILGALDNIYDTAIIISGDEDFLSTINIARERFKKRIENAYFRSSSSYKLRAACNSSIRLNKLISKFVEKKNK